MSEQASGAIEAPRPTAPNIYPALGYRDAKAAIRWLCEAFGFEERMVHPGDDGREVAHAELSLGPGIIMLGSQRADAPTAGDVSRNAAPDRGGEFDFARIPFALYVAVDDVDAHCERARAAGAEVIHELADTDYGSREYACRDLEGNVWSFGTYQPVAGD